ncbi:hypothetical protein PV331_11060 [Streptomyces sp. WI04-05B]|nr:MULTISPECIES: hypothetical protein [unclassified Streptomyces]MDX2542401.1 hypothetical protein [Streptomyces sp. WI04-05B]MDX2582580.1 hypothetical protein [Streptomyces sp. WI04-05A]MDX3747992.1 hypothetical protein [Streptomyces sp. AK08-02]
MTDPAEDTNKAKDTNAGAEAGNEARDQEQRLLALEKKRERYVWYYLAYFLFGIHLVAFVMIYAVKHAPK